MRQSFVVVALLAVFGSVKGEKIEIGDDSFDYDPNLFTDPPPGATAAPTLNIQAALGVVAKYFNIIGDSNVMGSLETVLRESYKFIRLADDLHEIKAYLNDIRLCFIALTVSGYVGIALYLLILCINKRKTNRADALNRARPMSAQGDEELNMGNWRADEGYHNTPSSRTPDPYRYPRSHHQKHFTSALQNTMKLDSSDSPTKQQLIVENHTASNQPITGVFRENGGPDSAIDRLPVS